MSTTRTDRAETVAVCAACGSHDAVQDFFYYEWREKTYDIFRCRSCTHQFVYPAIGPEDQAEIYSDKYFSADGDWVCGMFQGAYADAESQLRDEAAEVLSHIPTKTGKLLDVGCAGGVFLDEAQRRGFTVAGIELNDTQAESARSRFNIPVRTGRIEDIGEGEWGAEFDVVTLMDCLEHLPQPLDAVRKVSEWTRPGAVLFIRGPLSNSLVGRIKERARRLLRKPKRLPGYPLDANMFNKRSLTTMLDLAGFEVVDWIDSTDIFSNVVARRRSR